MILNNIFRHHWLSSLSVTKFSGCLNKPTDAKPPPVPTKTGFPPCTYESLGVSLLEEAKDTLAEDWFDSFWASRSNLRYSSPFPKGSGVTLSGLVGVWGIVGPGRVDEKAWESKLCWGYGCVCFDRSTHDSVTEQNFINSCDSCDYRHPLPNMGQGVECDEEKTHGNIASSQVSSCLIHAYTMHNNISIMNTSKPISKCYGIFNIRNCILTKIHLFIIFWEIRIIK